MRKRAGIVQRKEVKESFHKRIRTFTKQRNRDQSAISSHPIYIVRPLSMKPSSQSNSKQSSINHDPITFSRLF